MRCARSLHRHAPFPARQRRAALALALAGLVTLAACHQQEAAAPAPRPVVAVAVHADGTPAVGVVARRSTGALFDAAVVPYHRQDHRAARAAGRHREDRARSSPGSIPADAQKNAASAQAQLDAAQHSLVYAKQQLDRDQAQAHENLISTAQLEQTTNAYASAAAQRDQAAQQAALAKNQLQYTDLLADHAGVITAEQAQTGQNVSAGQAVYNLAWSGDIDVVVDVPESTLAALAVGQTAQGHAVGAAGPHIHARGCANCRPPPIRKAALIARISRCSTPARTCGSA